MTPQIHRLTADSPYETLALEQALLESRPDGVTLLLYRHRPSVIIGRTQNAWAECRTDRLRSDGVLLARRISGGGAVYHDPQNLNFSFVAAPEHYNVERQLRVILGALRLFGLDAIFSGRNDILVNGRKFSGNAFCVRSYGAFHHGTLLIGTDVERMTRYLSVPPDKIAAKGVRSVRARVINLRELLPDLTAADMADALERAFSAEYGRCTVWEPPAAVQQQARSLAKRNQSWTWLYGRTPPCDVTVRNRFAWGSLELNFQLQHGRVQAVHTFSDAMDPEFILALPAALTGCCFSGADLSAALAGLGTDPRIDDIRAFLLQRGY